MPRQKGIKAMKRIEKTISADWIEYMNAYRLYDMDQPQQTIAYDDIDLKNTKEFAQRNGYTKIVVIPKPKPRA